MNIFNEVGALAIATRLQRLSDQFRRDGELIYQHNGIAFQPKWFPVIYALRMKSALGKCEGRAHQKGQGQVDGTGDDEDFKHAVGRGNQLVRDTGELGQGDDAGQRGRLNHQDCLASVDSQALA
mgnify:CR=1 FL=1